MWISELSARSDLPLATVKFYLREGLLHPGAATGATRAHYDDSHVRRLRLVRALVEVAGLRLDAVRGVLAAVDDESLPLHEVIGTAHLELSKGDPAAPPTTQMRSRVDAMVRRWRWRVSPDSTHRAALARALDALVALDHPVSDELLDAYAGAMLPLAEHEVSAVRAVNPERATEMAVIGTLLLEPVLLTIRRLAQENVSSRRLTKRGRR